MSSGWEIKSLGTICEIVNGSTPLRTSREFWENGNFPWFTIDDIREQGRIIRSTKQKVTNAALKRLRILPRGSILLCCTASIGEYAITEIELSTNQQFNGLVIKDKKEVYPKFLLYFASTLKDTLSNLSGKTTIDFIPISRLTEIAVPIPSLEEQKRIVSFLDEAFAAIDKAKENAEKNFENARELFEGYLQNVFEKNGKGWEETSIKSEVELLVGFAFKSREYTEADDDILLLRGDNIMQGFLRWQDVKRWRKSEYEVFKKYQLREDDIVLAMDRPWVKAGLKIARLTKNDLPALLLQRTACLRSNSKLDNSFLFYLLRSNRFMNYLINVQTGIGVPHISGQQITDFTFNKPSLKAQLNIVEKLDALSEETKDLEIIYKQKIASLEELRKSILQKAFAGELTNKKVNELAEV